MGIDTDFSKAYAKAALAAGQKLPASGNVFVSMTDKYKEAIVPIAKELKVQLCCDSCAASAVCAHVTDMFACAVSLLSGKVTSVWVVSAFAISECGRSIRWICSQQTGW